MLRPSLQQTNSHQLNAYEIYSRSLTKTPTHFIDATDSLTSGCITTNTPNPPSIPVALRAAANASSDGVIGIIDTIMKDTYWKEYVRNKVQEESNHLAWMRTDVTESSSYPAPFPESTIFPMGRRPDSVCFGGSIASTKSTNGSEGLNDETDLWEKDVSKWPTNLGQTSETPGLDMTWANADNEWMLYGSPIQVEPFVVNTGLKIEMMDRDDVQKLRTLDVPVDATTKTVNEATIIDKGIEPLATVRRLPTNQTMIIPCTDNTPDRAVPTEKPKETKGRKKKKIGTRRRREEKKGKEPRASLTKPRTKSVAEVVIQTKAPSVVEPKDKGIRNTKVAKPIARNNEDVSRTDLVPVVPAVTPLTSLPVPIDIPQANVDLQKELEDLKRSAQERASTCATRSDEIEREIKRICKDVSRLEDMNKEYQASDALVDEARSNWDEAVDACNINTGLLGDALENVVKTTERLKVDMREMIEAAQDATQVSTDLVDEKVNQCAIKLHWLLDTCAGLSKRIDGVANTIAANQVSIPVKFIESYPPGVLLGLVTSASKRLVDRVCELLPEVFITAKCHALTQTITNIGSTPAAAAALLQLAVKMVTAILYTDKDDFQHYAQTAIHFYHAIYSQFREELIMIARLPGPQCRDSSVQRRATFELHEILRLALCQAKIDGLKLSNGECFAGSEDTLSDKWLPLLYFFPHCAASAYGFPMNLFHSASHETDQTTLLINWYNSFGRKFASLLLYQAPLFAQPLYPDPQHSPPLTVTNIEQEKRGIPLSGADAAATFLSWIGRALLLSGYHNNQDIAKPCAMMALATAKDLREDLSNAIDSFLRADVARGIVTPPKAFSNAPKFLFDVFNRLKELSGTGNRYQIDSDKDISINGLEARHWLPRVHITGMPIDLEYLTNSPFSSMDSAESGTIN